MTSQQPWVRGFRSQWGRQPARGWAALRGPEDKPLSAGAAPPPAVREMRACGASVWDDRGSYTLEALICLTVLVPFLALFAAFGLAGLGDTTAANAAAAAARAASQARAPEAAQAAGREAGRSSLAQSGRTCSASTVKVDVSNFPTGIGEQGQVTATVTCTIPLGQLTVPGLPGSKTLTATRTSYVDRYAAREEDEQ